VKKALSNREKNKKKENCCTFLPIRDKIAITKVRQPAPMKYFLQTQGWHQSAAEE
jgi:hypothetical protein